MKENIKHALAKKNDREKLFLDDEIGNEVSKNVTPAEENAQDRKCIKLLLDIIVANKLTVTAEQQAKIDEFLSYNSKVETIKDNIKSKFGGGK